MTSKNTLENAKRRAFGATCALGLTLAAACTKTEGAAPKPHGDASPPPSAERADPGDPGWRSNGELERAFEGIGFQKNAAKNLSDAALLRLGDKEFLVVVSDEGHDFGVTTLGAGREGKTYDLSELPRGDLAVDLPKRKSKVEVDLEAVATEADRVLLAGSASLKRKKPKEGDSTSEALGEIVPASGAGASYSNYVYELRARDAGGVFPELDLVSARDLRELLLGIPLIATFRDIPSKDNGLDVEGVAMHGGFFYFGLRGPLLRGRALIVRTHEDFSEPETYTLELDSLGVRSLTFVEGAAPALYILAGPTLPREDRFELYRFTGSEKHPADVRPSDITRVASVPSSHEERPEGLFALDSDLCVLVDGVPGGAPRCRALF